MTKKIQVSRPVCSATAAGRGLGPLKALFGNPLKALFGNPLKALLVKKIQGLSEILTGIKGIPYRFTGKNKQCQHSGQCEKCRQTEPWCVDIGPSLRQQAT